MRFFSLLILLSFASTPLFATHNVGGYITYKHLNAFTYEITVNIYGDPNSSTFQKTDLLIDFGDKVIDTIRQPNLYPPINQNVQLKEWVVNHTYSMAGEFTISVSDLSRNAVIANITDPFLVPLYLESKLKILQGSTLINSSPIIQNDPITMVKVGAQGQMYLAAQDPDGDHLQYRLVACKGARGIEAPGYQFIKDLSIHPISGLINYKLNSFGYFNYAVEITEYRNDVLIGSILYDMQIRAIDAFDTSMVFLDLSGTRDSCGLPTIIAFVGDTINFSGIPKPFGIIDQLQFPLKINTNVGPSPSTRFFSTWITDSTDVRCKPYYLNVRTRIGGGILSALNDHLFQIRILDSSLICDSLCSPKIVSVREHPTLQENILLYPNPFSDHFFIKTPLNVNLSNWSIQLFNLQGQLVEERSIQQHQQIITTSLNAGIYIYRLMGDSVPVLQGKLIVN